MLSGNIRPDKMLFLKLNYVLKKKIDLWKTPKEDDLGTFTMLHKIQLYPGRGFPQSSYRNVFVYADI